MAKAYLGLGTNIGDKKQNLCHAIDQIKAKIGNVCSLSSFYETAPWGFESENQFVNAALCVETTLLPEELLNTTQLIERELGRTHKSVNGIYHDRIIDIDILLYDDLTLCTPVLTIPHPHMTERLFVMAPMAEIAPELRLSPNGLTLKELKNRLEEEDNTL